MVNTTISGIPTNADFDVFEDVNFFPAAYIYQLARIMRELKAYHRALYTTGTVDDYPDHGLDGVVLAQGTSQYSKFRIRSDGSDNLLFEANTGTDASPTWVTIISFAAGGLEHGDLSGLSDDDHPQYTLVDGTRSFTGTVGGIDPTAAAHLATKGYVDGRQAIVSSDTTKLAVTSGTNTVTLDPSALVKTADALLRDGSQAMLADLDLGSFSITNVDDVAAASGTFTTSLTVSGSPVVTQPFLDVSDASYVEVLSGSSSYTVTHNLNSQNVIVFVRDSADEHVTPDIVRITGADTVFLNFAASFTGVVIVQAVDQAVAGNANRSFTFTQTAPATTWTIEHNLGTQQPVTEIIDADNKVIIPDEIEHTDSNTTVVTFGSPASGVATSLAVGALLSTAGGGGGASDHGALTGLSDDDHTQYTRVDGTRAFTGSISHDNNAITNVSTLTATTVTGTTGQFAGTLSAQNVSASNSLTISGSAPLINGLTQATVSGSNATTGPINLVGSRGGNVSIAGSTITFDAPAASTATGGGGIENVVEDTSPQLGGDLDVNSKVIRSVGAGNDVSVVTHDQFLVTASGGISQTAVTGGISHTSTLGGITLEALAGGVTIDATLGNIEIDSAAGNVTIDAAGLISLNAGGSDDVFVGGSTDRVSNKNVAKAIATFSAIGGSVTEHTSNQFNVSSVTRTSAGKYRVNFTRSFANANYGFTGSAKPTAAGNTVVVIEDIAVSGRQTGSIDVAVLQNGVITESDKITVVCYGDLS